MQVVRVDPFDEADFDRWFAVVRQADRELWPDFPGWQRAERLAQLRNEDGPEQHVGFVAVDDGAVVGTADLEMFRRENQHVARVNIAVPRVLQRRGVGTALLAAVEAEARATGRTELGGMDDTPVRPDYVDTAKPFAERHGFEPALEFAKWRIVLPLSPESMLALQQNPKATPAGYSLLIFGDRWPDEWMADRCELGRRMSTDIPMGDMDLDEELWDEARVRQIEASLDEQNRDKVSAVARHDATGRLVAYSEVVVPRGAPESAWQHDTLVMREHRGHGLGFAVKVANLAAVAERFPRTTSISTFNAAVNAHMIAINEEIGFEVISTAVYWLKKLGPAT
jgi:GNAT superfamily N-acetyltransferase